MPASFGGSAATSGSGAGETGGAGGTTPNLGGTAGAGLAGGAIGAIGMGGTAGAGGGIIIPPGTGGTAACALDCTTQSFCADCYSFTQPSASCTLVTTGLSAPLKGVDFDCSPLDLGTNGYLVNDQGQIVLTGDACDALQTNAPHRIDLVLGCALDK